ncbi:MAG TPA: alpha/beta hydrolase [Candidatus Limnocylindrales bacterium]|nr:alpha/beta hydrolase [Candidatus Limnocylindrales bacterium]
MTEAAGGMGPTSHSFFSQRLRLHYVDYGSEGKPLLVLVHGGQDHCRNWDFVAQRLRRHYHVIAPDLRGHGDSAWAVGSQYGMPEYVLDLAQLLRHVEETPVTLVGHSLGGAIVLHYAGIYPDNLVKVCAIEGLGPPPQLIKDVQSKPIEERMQDWIKTMQSLPGRKPREYSTLAEAEARMREANPHLSAAMAKHLTIHGVMRLENGNYTWKFDNYVRAWGPYRYDVEGVQRLWDRIRCPVLLVRGAESWASNPVEDGRAAFFHDYTYAEVEKAGHWVHHDRFEVFMGHLESFLGVGE